MRVEAIKVEALTIFDAPTLDPVTVILQDVARNHGRLIIECYGKAWSAYWGAMGERSLREFVCGCHADYIANRLIEGGFKHRSKKDQYVLRIVVAVQEALRSSSPTPAEHK